MGRSARLAVGAIAAALAAEQVGTNQLAAVVVLAMAALLVIGEVAPRASVRRVWPIIIGAGLIAARLAVLPAGTENLRIPPDGNGPWTLAVMSTGSPREGHQSATLATLPGVEPSFLVAASLPRYPVIVPGDRVVVDGSIRPRPDSPYGAYLERIGAVGSLTTRTLDIEPAPIDLKRRLEDLRRGAADALARVLPEPEAGLAAGILIGLRDRVDRDLAGSFTTAGVSHVVAISGWNIAIVAAAVAAFAGRLGRRRRSLVTILAIVAYVAFAGASAAVVRAAAMAGVVLLARESGRAGRAAAALGWAATVLLLSDPGLISDAGFQLSSLATAGLIAWATPLTTWIEARGRGRMPRWLAESLGVSLAAQAATLPIVLVSFGRLAVLSPLVNLTVVPLVAPAMAVGLAALAGGALVVAGVPEVVGAVVAAPGWVVLRLLVAIVQVAAAMPFSSVTLDPPWDVAAATTFVAGLGGLTWWTRSRRPNRSASTKSLAGPAMAGKARSSRTHDADPSRRGRRAASLALSIAVIVTGGVVAARPSGVARVTILDVGQGDAVLVEGSRGGRLLIDGGPDPDKLLVALDLRIPPWDRRIDMLILSHPHEDHVAGLALLLERYQVDRVLEPGMRGPGPGYAAWLRHLAGSGAPVWTSIAAGDRLAVDEIDLRVLWPIRGTVPAEPPDGGTAINNVSVVLRGQVGTRQFLLMGDVEEEIDPELLASGLAPVDLLKVAHHGSRTATTEAFVAAVRPRIAVASAGAGNPYGHPTRATLERLAGVGAQVLRTDRDGTVVVGFGADELTVRTEGSRADGRRARTAASAGAMSAGPAAARFRCAVPVTAIIPERERVDGDPDAGRDGGGDAVAGRAATVGYHRLDDRSRAGGGRRPPALPGSPALAGAPFAPRGRGGRLAGHAHRRPRPRRRPAAGGVGRAAARYRQGAAGRRSGPRAPPRRRFSRRADRASRPGPPRGDPVVTVSPLAYFWGDDELGAARGIEQLQAALGAASGSSPERWMLRGDRNQAAAQIASLNERVATPVMFGGGSLAVVTNPGPLVQAIELRTAFLATLTLVAPGNGLVILDATRSGGGPSKRLADAVTAAGGTIRQFQSPSGSLAGWIAAEARLRNVQLASGTAKALADRIGGLLTEKDIERRHLTRVASMELEKLALYRGGAPVTPDDVKALVAEAVPGSVWAFTDAIGERGTGAALELLDRLLDNTPEPVLLAVLHRRVRELLELGDRLASGERLPAAAKAIGINNEFRARTLADQARRWTTAELTAALDGLVELDAMVKGAPGFGQDEVQRRLSFSLWVIDHVSRDGRGRA